MRRLRIVAACQLELLPAPGGPDPAGVWAALPERNRATTLAVLARMIAAGIVDDDAEEEVS